MNLTKEQIVGVVLIISAVVLAFLIQSIGFFSTTNKPLYDKTSLETAVKAMDSSVVSCSNLNGNSMDCVFSNAQTNKTGMVRLQVASYSYLGQTYVGFTTDKVFYEIGKVEG